MFTIIHSASPALLTEIRIGTSIHKLLVKRILHDKQQPAMLFACDTSLAPPFMAADL